MRGLASRCPGRPAVRQHAWSERHTAENYLKLLSTVSAHQTPSPEVRAELYADVREVVERFGGQAIQPCLGALFHSEVIK